MSLPINANISPVPSGSSVSISTYVILDQSYKIKATLLGMLVLRFLVIFLFGFKV